MTQINKHIVQNLAQTGNIELPLEHVWELPEKVLQFGTGVLLRGLPDYYINKANNEGVFNGRIVVVKSTGSGSLDEFGAQDNLYTHCINGILNDELYENYIINAAISRVIDAKKNWPDVIACASNPDLKIIISNTTEVGIALLETDNIQASPPQSFPGKLLAFLYARYQVFGGSKESGMVIIPTELIVDNGNQLKNIVLTLAQLHHLEQSFINWLVTVNDWCNSLVDRIVPGTLPQKEKQQLEHAFGYTDDLAIMSEPYSLWAIETKSERTRQVLSFSTIDKNVIITADIQKYRELKLRLLNGTHTFSCGLAFLYHFTTVNAAMNDAIFHSFVHDVMYNETLPCLINSSISEEEAKSFADAVINRFANPFIQHKWLSITVQYTSKMKQRCVPLLMRYNTLHSQPPIHMALGFAAFLLFMKVTVTEDNKYYGIHNGEHYPVQDDEAKRWYQLWNDYDEKEVVSKALSDTGLSGENLLLLPRFATAVEMYLSMMLSGASLQELLAAKS